MKEKDSGERVKSVKSRLEEEQDDEEEDTNTNNNNNNNEKMVCFGFDRVQTALVGDWLCWLYFSANSIHPNCWLFCRLTGLACRLAVQLVVDVGAAAAAAAG